MDDIYEYIKEHNLNKKRKILLVFNDIIADMLNNKKHNPILNDLFISGRKLNIFLVFFSRNLSLLFQKYYTKFNTLFCY